MNINQQIDEFFRKKGGTDEDLRRPTVSESERELEAVKKRLNLHVQLLQQEKDGAIKRRTVALENMPASFGEWA